MRSDIHVPLPERLCLSELCDESHVFMQPRNCAVLWCVPSLCRRHLFLVWSIVCALSKRHSIECNNLIRAIPLCPFLLFLPVMQDNGQCCGKCLRSSPRNREPDKGGIQRWPAHRNPEACFWVDLCWNPHRLHAHFLCHPLSFPSQDTPSCLGCLCDLENTLQLLRVVPSSWNIIEIPSFYRGLVALWVIIGLILITAYQSDVFATEGVITQSYLQPGSSFTSGSPTSSATTKCFSRHCALSDTHYLQFHAVLSSSCCH